MLHYVYAYPEALYACMYIHILIRRNNPQDQQHKNKAQGEKQDDDDDSSDDDYPDDNCNYIPSHYVPPSMPSSQALLK